MPLPLKPFHMIRHGQSTANAAYRFAGVIDVNLTDQGKDEAQKAGLVYEALRDKPSIIIHSKLSRARDTASIINEKLNIEMIENTQIHEQDFGDWENGPIDDFIDCYTTRQTPTNGETFNDFDQRIRRSLTDILNTYENPLIVCHGGVFRAFKSLYNQAHERVANAAPYSFTPNEANKNFPWEIESLD